MDKTNSFISNFESKDAWRLFVKILLFAPVLLLVVAVNIRLDPAGLYRKTTDKHGMNKYNITQALVVGRNMAALRPTDDRLLQKYFIENLTSAPDIVVLGSSHAMWVGDNIFPNKRVINNAVMTAVLADYLGIFEGYAKKNLYPQRVICVLDPQLISFPIVSEIWVSIKEDTFGMLDRLGIRSQRIKQPMIPQSWLNLFSFSYFQQCMKELQHSRNQYTHPVKEDIDDEQFLFFKDGRREELDAEKIRRKTIRGLYLVKNEQRLEQTKPDKELEVILEKFIRYLIGHHIRVTLCLLPVHPQLYKILLEPQKRQGEEDIVDVEHYYRGLAQRLNLEITGSYDPAVCGLEDKDFYDGDHIRNDTIEKMFKQKGSPCSMPGL